MHVVSKERGKEGDKQRRVEVTAKRVGLHTIHYMCPSGETNEYGDPGREQAGNRFNADRHHTNKRGAQAKKERIYFTNQCMDIPTPNKKEGIKKNERIPLYRRGVFF